jgi:4-hydroxy-tetrahydrodipicolinate synthase
MKKNIPPKDYPKKNQEITIPAKKIKGLLTALITPFDQDKIDEKGLEILIERQLKAGVDGIVFLGTTGEGPTLSDAEKGSVIKKVRKKINNKPLILGAGSNCTRQTIEQCLRFKDWGADVLMIAPPYYNKPSPEGVFLHYEQIITRVGLPVIIYNTPRTGLNIDTSTLSKIASFPQVLGVKEASFNLIQMQEVIEKIISQRPDFCILSGDDILTYSLLALGGDGVISVASNLLPEEMVLFVKKALEGRWDEARQDHYRLSPLFKALFIETNPIPVKTAHNLWNLPAGGVRLPLSEMKNENMKVLAQVLANYQGGQ